MLFRLRVPLVLGLAALLTGCQSTSSAPPAPSVAVPAPPVPAPAPKSPFDGARAYILLKAQCDFGPRPPRSSAHEKCKQLIVKELTPFADSVDTQEWTWRDTDRKVTLPLTNIIGVINPSGKKTVCLFTHWDTRPTADQELEVADKKKPIIGANDGASGVAVLLELARVFHAKKPDVRVVLLFVDGEDWGPGEEKMYLGALHFAAHPGRYKPDWAILLDMIGDKDLTVWRELSSEIRHPELNDKVWGAAQALGYTSEFPAVFVTPDGRQSPTKWQISDDHDAFFKYNIPAIDLIDFDYASWHTTHDTADKCSAASLKVVGDVVAKVVYDEK